MNGKTVGRAWGGYVDCRGITRRCDGGGKAACSDLPNHAQLSSSLQDILAEHRGGLANDL